MSASRHFFSRGTVPDAQLKADITDDIASARTAQRDLTAAGQYGAADRMSATVDGHLDELNDVRNGSWKPRHA
ncbi:hypothetical protein ACFWPV_22600 [Streptomyces uncialis]|uniref:hypothetical protein n=1 Tax=Streptomyces uncialis TaxID=1048205 RepID=UPI0036664A38